MKLMKTIMKNLILLIILIQLAQLINSQVINWGDCPQVDIPDKFSVHESYSILPEGWV